MYVHDKSKLIVYKQDKSKLIVYKQDKFKHIVYNKQDNLLCTYMIIYRVRT